MSMNDRPDAPGTPDRQPPKTHEPPAENERPDENLPGEQPRSRSNEGDPQDEPT